MTIHIKYSDCKEFLIPHGITSENFSYSLLTSILEGDTHTLKLCLKYDIIGFKKKLLLAGPESLNALYPEFIVKSTYDILMDLFPKDDLEKNTHMDVRTYVNNYLSSSSKIIPHVF